MISFVDSIPAQNRTQTHCSSEEVICGGIVHLRQDRALIMKMRKIICLSQTVDEYTWVRFDVFIPMEPKLK